MNCFYNLKIFYYIRDKILDKKIIVEYNFYVTFFYSTLQTLNNTTMFSFHKIF